MNPEQIELAARYLDAYAENSGRNGCDENAYGAKASARMLREMAFTQMRAAAEVPVGYVIVPKEPTHQMQDEGAESLKETLNVGTWGEFGGVSLGDAESCYRAMLSAAARLQHGSEKK